MTVEYYHRLPRHPPALWIRGEGDCRGLCGEYLS
jgi:hypothetical protein